MTDTPDEETASALARLVAQAQQNYEAMSPVDRAIHDADQRRSFVRGQSGRDPGESALVTEVLRQRQHLAALAERLGQLEAGLKFYATEWELYNGSVGVVTIASPALKSDRGDKARALLSPASAGQREGREDG